MKTVMNKPLSAVTALMAAAVLMAAVAVLSCNPEVEITKHDWKAVNADRDTSILSIGSKTDKVDYAPTFKANLSVDPDAKKDTVEITFPKEADILQKGDGQILSALQKFLKFYSYSKAPSPNSEFVADPLGGEIGYTFEKRLKETVTIKLASLPDDRNVVAKVLASEYTYASGRKLGGSGDTKYGIPYYDQYATLAVSDGDILAEHVGAYTPQYRKDWTLTISAPSGVPDPDKEGKVVSTVANLSDSVSEDTWREDILKPLVGKFKLRKFDIKGGKWSDVPSTSATFAYVNGALAGMSKIEVSFTPEEFVPYVVEVTGGLENLQTSATVYGVNQRVKVTGGNNTPAFNLKKVTTNAYQWIDMNKKGRTLATGKTPVVSSGTLISTDKEGKNLRVELKFAPIVSPDDDSSANVYPKEMDLGEFKKYFKIGYQIDGKPIKADEDVDAGKVAFLDIKRIWYGSDTKGDDEGKKNLIFLTLNSDYTLDSFVDLYVFIAPGFKYDHDQIIFGNYENWQYTVDGVRHFDSYGQISGVTGTFTKKAPSGGGGEDSKEAIKIELDKPVTAALAFDDVHTYTIKLSAGTYTVWLESTKDIGFNIQKKGDKDWKYEDDSDEEEITISEEEAGDYIIRVKGASKRVFGDYALGVDEEKDEDDAESSEG